jgi:methyl coenzyme M reductase subunit D
VLVVFASYTYRLWPCPIEKVSDHAEKKSKQVKDARLELLCKTCRSKLHILQNTAEDESDLIRNIQFL